MSVSDYKTHCFPSARPREHFSWEDSCKPISAGLAAIYQHHSGYHLPDGDSGV